jgi:tetratricopeptide (TPR) repeat protein
MQAHGALAHGLFSANRHVQALGAQKMALAIAEQLGDATEIAHHLANLAVIAATVGDVALGYSAASAAHRRFLSMGMHDGHFFANAVTLSRHAAHLGRLDEAQQALEPVWAADPAHMGQAIHALARVADLGLQLVLGDAKTLQTSFLALQRIDAPALLPLVQASVLLARLRYAQTLGQDAAPHRAMLATLGAQHPSLRDNPVLYREWARWDEAPAALTQLDRLAAAATQAGADAAARSLQLASIELLLPQQPAQAARRAQRLAKDLPLGLMAGVFLPEAWHLLARALHAGGREAGARRCLRQAQAWVDLAVLPDPHPGRRHAFANSPLLRRLLEPPLEVPSPPSA